MVPAGWLEPRDTLDRHKRALLSSSNPVLVKKLAKGEAQQELTQVLGSDAPVNWPEIFVRTPCSRKNNLARRIQLALWHLRG
jgi:hypothetical protein